MSWIERRARSFGHAFRGIRWVVTHERNGKYHVMHVVIMALLLPLTGAFGAVAVALALVAFGCECVNSGIERAVDLACDGEHAKLAKIAKDAASAAVLCMLTGAGIVDITAVIAGIQRLL